MRQPKAKAQAKPAVTPAAVGNPFDCTTPLVFVSQGGGGDTQLYDQQFTDTGGSFAQVGDNTQGIKYNSIGFDPLDDYIYGYGSPGLLRIGTDGEPEVLGLPWYNGAQVGSNHGAFDPQGNYYTGGGNTIWEISAADIAAADANPSPTAHIPVTQTITTGPAEGGSDWTYANGSLWSAGPDGDVWQTNLSTLQVTDYPNVVQDITVVSKEAYGAAWTYGNGTLGFDSNAGDANGSLAIQTVDISDPNAPKLIHVTSGPGSGNNDGASCSLPADLAITKTVNGATGSPASPVSVQPGAAVTWKMVVTNNGPGGSSQQFVDDTLPAGVTNATITAPGASCTTSTPAAGAPFTCTYGYLPPQGTETITITATAPPGIGTEFDNTATVSGNELDTNPNNNTATAYARTPTASFTMVKSGSIEGIGGTSGATTSTPIDYTFTVHNTSTVALSGLAVSDPKVGPVNCPATTLAPQGSGGDSVVCTARYLPTQADMDAGTIHNVATATTVAPGGATVGPVTSTFDITMAAPSSTITLAKTANPTTGLQVGNGVAYSFTVTNTGNVSLNAVSVTDPMFPGGIGCDLSGQPAPGLLAPGAAVNCAGQSITVNQAEFDAGSITNTATANGTAVRGGPPAPAQSTAVVGMAAAGPAIALTKTAADTTQTATAANLGDNIAYTIVATNTGNVTETVTVTDPMFPSMSCTQAGVAPGGTVNCPVQNYTVGQPDVDAGSISNTATASGVPVRGTPNPVTAQASATVPTIAATPGIAITKTAADTTQTATAANLGDNIAYTIVATNTGNVTENVTVTDPMFPSMSCTQAGVAPGGTVNCPVQNYTVGQPDIDAGSIQNTATASGVPVRGTPNPVTAQASATVTTVAAVPGVAITKTVADTTQTATAANLGDNLAYTIIATNTGNVTETVTVTDPMFPSMSCTQAGVAPGGTVNCPLQNYTVGQPDIDAGSISNTATANGVPVRGTPNPVTAQATVTVQTVPAVPGVAITKTAADTTQTATAPVVGDNIQYTIIATNTGNVTETVTVTDPMFPSMSCTQAGVAPGGTVNCPLQDHTVTQADVNLGTITNTATASGVPVRGTPNPVTAQATATVQTIAAMPAVAITKTAADQNPASTSGAQVGDEIDYTIVATNTGNVTEDITVTDPMFPSLSCTQTGVDPNVTVSCPVQTYDLVQADVDRGYLQNTATADGNPVRGNPVSANATATVDTVAADPEIALVKVATDERTGNASGAQTGDVIDYTFVVTNTGNVTLHDVNVTDEDADVGTVTCDEIAAPGLAPGATVDCAAANPHTVTQAEFDAYLPLVNTAFAHGTSPDQTPPPLVPHLVRGAKTVAAVAPLALPATTVTSAPATATVTLAPAVAALNPVKSAIVTPAADQDKVKVGDTIEYQIVITNTGNVTMYGFTPVDKLAGMKPVICPALPNGLAPKASVTCTTGPGGYTVTQADVDRGYVLNSATVPGTPPAGTHLPPYTSPKTSVTVQAVPPKPSISLVKTAHVTPAADQNALKVGDHISYTFLVTNTGNVTLTNVGVSDPTGGPVSCPTPTLAPGQSETCATVHDHVVTAADISRGKVVNTATAHGDPPQGLKTTTSNSSSATVDSDTDLASTGSAVQGLAVEGGLALLAGLLMLLAGIRRRGNGRRAGH